jgi:hypothetical protein
MKDARCRVRRATSSGNAGRLAREAAAPTRRRFRWRRCEAEPNRQVPPRWPGEPSRVAIRLRPSTASFASLWRPAHVRFPAFSKTNYSDHRADWKSGSGQERPCHGMASDGRSAPVSCRATGGRRRANRANSDLMQCSKIATYSITSSARASRVGGTSRWSALAVCRLITSSNLAARMTGRLAGFSPLRILPA